MLISPIWSNILFNEEAVYETGTKKAQFIKMSKTAINRRQDNPPPKKKNEMDSG